jgi:hypothetical protein
MKKIHIYILAIIALTHMAISCNPDYTPPVDPPIVYLNIEAQSDNNFRIPAKIMFINLSTIDSMLETPEYLWDFGDGTELTSNADTIFYTYYNPGDYDVYLIANIPNMEPDTFKYPLTIKPLYEYIFTEAFESYDPKVATGDSLSSSWLVVDNDNGTPGDPILFDKAWKVVYNSEFQGNVAVSTSYYTNSPVPDADNWMISPKIPLSETDSFTVQWDAMSLTKSGDWPESYQVYISNTTQDIDSCVYLIKEVEDEWWSKLATIPGNGIHRHKLDISQFTGDTIYLGFRLITPAPGGSQLAIDSIRVTSYYDYIPVSK